MGYQEVLQGEVDALKAKLAKTEREREAAQDGYQALRRRHRQLLASTKTLVCSLCGKNNRPKEEAQSTAEIRELLGGFCWPADLEPMTRYYRAHDDSPPSEGKGIYVVIGNDGDAWVETTNYHNPTEGMRFRTYAGGGRSTRVRNALLILALAIKLDSEELPDPE